MENGLIESQTHGGRSEITAAIRGESEAIRRLWEHHRRWVAAILLAHKPREIELEDLLQDVAMTFVRTIGELRDEESARAALQAGESGHLVLATMHTIDTAETIGRMIELFPSAKQPLVRQIMAATLRGVVSQRLLPRSGGGRAAAVEVMVNTPRVADLILDPAKTDDIPSALEEGEYHDMQSFRQHLIQLVLAGTIDSQVASGASGNPHDFEISLAHAIRRRQADESAAAPGAGSQGGPHGSGGSGSDRNDGHGLMLRVAGA
ncbi:MAG: ATPase, T2SS/T4P/T4SS family [Gaiellales bacterium]